MTADGGMSHTQEDQTMEQKLLRIEELIDDVRATRAAGKTAEDGVIMAAHPELMPELADELAKLQRVQAARKAAEAPTVDINLLPDSDAGDEPRETPQRPRPDVQVPGYSLLRELSRGGQGVVYLALQLSTGRKIALKLMREGPLADERALARFKREASVLAALNHPNIVTILDTGTTLDGNRYIAMDYISGRALDEYVQERQKKDQNDPSRLLRLFLKICAAVSAAHLKGVVHRDLKPSNIRIDDRGEPHVLDFGLARTAIDGVMQGGTEPVSITGEFLGSLPWSSPEQAEGDPDKIDIRSDVYSLGVILYQMLTGGRFPYEVVGNIRDVLNNILTAEPTPPSKVLAAIRAKQLTDQRRNRPDFVNEAIEKIVLKALAKKRERRYQSAGEFGRDIANYLAGRPTATRASSKPFSARVPSWSRVTVATVIVIAFLLVSAYSVYHFVTRVTPSTGASATVLKPKLETVPIAIEPVRKRVDLLSLADPDKDTVTGKWSMNGGVLMCPHSPAARFEFPYLPPAEYDLRVVFTDSHAHNGLEFTCARGKVQFSFAVGTYENKVSGFSLINGANVWKNPTTTRKSAWLVPAKWHTAVVKVRNSRIEGYLDDTLIVSYETNYNDLEVAPNSRLRRNDVIGLCVHNDDARFRTIEVLEITGEGQVLPRIAPTIAAAPVNTAPPPKPQIPANAKAFGGHHYKLILQNSGWNDAQQQCKAMGGQLACLESAAEQEFVQTLKGKDVLTWTGGQRTDAGKWEWSNRVEIDRSRISGELLPEHEYVFLSRSGVLQARPQNGQLPIAAEAVKNMHGFICEWEY
jgi:serine/threonine protein kinase